MSSISNRTAALVAHKILAHSKTKNDALEIVEALSHLSGEKHYRGSVALVFYFVQHAPRELHDSQRSTDIHEEELGSA
jgi:hypothetical protein